MADDGLDAVLNRPFRRVLAVGRAGVLAARCEQNNKGEEC